MTGRGGGKRGRGRSGSSPAASDAVELLALTDHVYAAGGDPDAVAEWLSELAEVLDVETCRLIGTQHGSGGLIAASRQSTSERDPAVKCTQVELGGAERLKLEILSRGRIGAEAGVVVRALAPHVVRARENAQPAAPTGTDLSAATLDRLAVAVIVLDSRGQLLHANQAGRSLLETGAGIVADVDGLVRFGARTASESLADLRAQEPAGARSRPATRFVVEREGASPLEVLAVSLEGLDLDDACAVALFVSDPDLGLQTPPSLFRELYGLSRRESEVVGQILLGHSLDETATDLGIHRETVRMHLKQVFKKVGTRRQVDLVRLLLPGVQWLRWE